LIEPDLDNDSIVPGTGGWYRSIKISSSDDHGAGDFSYKPVFYRRLLQVLSKRGLDTAAGYVANFAEKDDLVLFNSNFVVIPFDYYFKTYENLYSIQVEKHGVPLDLFDSGILEPKMTDERYTRVNFIVERA
jgi:hypothetical protein